MGFEPSGHAKDMLQERQIPEEWMWRTLTSPDRQEVGADGNIHYIKSIPEHGGRFLARGGEPNSDTPPHCDGFL